MPPIPQQYKVASSLTGFFLVPNIFIGSNYIIKCIIIAVIGSFFLPLIPRRAPNLGKKIAYALSLLYTTIFGAVITFMGYSLLKAKNLSEFEGPRGEGTPLAYIGALVILTLVFFTPWLLCSIHLSKQYAKKFDTLASNDE